MRLSQRRRDQVRRYWPLAWFAVWLTVLVIGTALLFQGVTIELTWP